MNKNKFKEVAEQRISRLQQSGPVWLDVFTTLQLLFISKSTLRRWEKKQEVTRYKIGGKVYYDKRQIDSIIAKLAVHTKH